MLVTQVGRQVGGIVYGGECPRCGCKVLVREQEIIKEWVEDGQYTEKLLFVRCPTLLCGHDIDLKRNQYLTPEEYADLVAKYGPEV